MTPNEVKAKFQQHNKYAADFIRWAESYGIKFDAAEVSDWQNGKRRMTKTAQLCLLVYFSDYCG